MSLIPSPLDVNNAAAQPAFNGYDLQYSYRAQLPDAKSVVAEYVSDETESDNIGYNKKLVVKHDDRTATARRLIQLKADFPDADGVLKRVTLNCSVIHNENHTFNNVTQLLEELRAVLGQTDFGKNLFNGAI